MAKQPQPAGGLLLAKWTLLGRAVTTPALGRVAMAVLWQLCDRYNHESGAAWPSFNRLAKDTGASARQVKRAVTDLERAGLIAIIQRGDRVRSNRYRPLLDGGDADVTTVVTQTVRGGDADVTDVVTPMSQESIYQPGHKAGVEINGICERHKRPQAPPDGSGVAADATPTRLGASGAAAELCSAFWDHFPKRIRVADAERLLGAICDQSPAEARRVVEAAAAYARYVAARQITASYQLSPETFIRDQRYRDDWDKQTRDHVAEQQHKDARKAAGKAQGAGKRGVNGASQSAARNAPQRAQKTTPVRCVIKAKRNVKEGW